MITIASDLHFSNFSSFGYEKTNLEFKGCNMRFHHIASAFREVVTSAVKNNSEALVIPGDIFHERGRLPIPVLNAVHKLFEEASSQVNLILMPGNHDFASLDSESEKQAIHSIYTYKDICTVTSEAQLIETDSFILCLVPFILDKEVLIETCKNLFFQLKSKKYKKPSVLFLHTGFDGAEVGPINWAIPHPLKPSDIPKFDFIFSGHYHKHQIVGQVTYVGGLLQHDQGERNYTPGFIHLQKDSWKFIENVLSPRFYLLETSDQKEIKKLQKNDKDYLTVRWFGDALKAKEIKESLTNTVVDVQKVVSFNLRSDIKTSDTTPDIISKYVATKVQDVEKRKAIEAMGLTLFNGTKP